MIQRIQTLWLILITVFSGLLLTGTIVEFTGTSSVYDLSAGCISTVGENNLITIQKTVPLMIILVLAPILSTITIFLYKYRKIQIKLSFVISGLIILSVLLGVYYSVQFMKSVEAGIIFNIKLLLPFLSLLFAVLAFKAIRKDKNLVKSYDRLR
jgi:hypothetical protein